MERKVYICAVTSTRVRLIGPFDDQATAGKWGSANLDNPCWNTVELYDCVDENALLTPINPADDTEPK